MKPKILLIADVPNWIFDKHCQTFIKYLSDTFNFTVLYHNQPYPESEFDLIYPLEFNLVEPKLIKNPQKYITGIRSYVSWERIPEIKLIPYLRNYFRQVHVVNKSLFKTFNTKIENLKYVTHGVDIEEFKPQNKQQNARLQVGWAGNTSNPNKGFFTCLARLEQHCDIDFKTCGYGSNNHIKFNNMKDFYNTLDILVCASQTEGNSNVLLEAAAMELAIITTVNGTVNEYLNHLESAILVQRSESAFINAINQLKHNPELIKTLGVNARKSLISNGFSLENKISEFKEFFINNII